MSTLEERPESPLEELSEDECRRLLQSQRLGRLAIVVDRRPQIFPVNYAFDEDVVVFRTSAGMKLEHGPLSAVAFEIDGMDEDTKTAWSVMVEGTGQDITEALDERSERLRRLPVQPAAPGERNDWLAVYVRRMSGRRFKIAGA